MLRERKFELIGGSLRVSFVRSAVCAYLYLHALCHIISEL